MFPRPPRPERQPPERQRGRAQSARIGPQQRSRIERERLQRQLLFASIGAVALLAVSTVGFGLYRELLGFPREAVAVVYGEPIRLRAFTDSLADEMRRLQAQAGTGLREETSPQRAESQIQRLIGAQETLPEDILENEIQRAIIRYEGRRRDLSVPPPETDNKINEFLAFQRDALNQPTATPTTTSTPRPTSTPTPEGWTPSPTPTRTLTLSPTPTGSPTGLPTDTPTPTSTPTPDPEATPTATNVPRATRTPVITPTVPPTLEPAEFERAYRDLVQVLRSEESYRRSVEDELLRTKVRDAVGAGAPLAGPAARVLRLATSTSDEAKVALISLEGGFSTFEELVDQVSDRPAEGTVSGDLGWVAQGAESREFDDVVFSLDTPLDSWTEPFGSSHHFEVVKVLERSDSRPYDEKNRDKIRDRRFTEWLNDAKSSPEVVRELAPQERQWAIDRASKGIFVTETRRR